MNLKICPLSEDEFSLWDRFVDESPKGTLFHKSFWLKASGREFIIYAHSEGGELFAGIALTYNTKFGFKMASHPTLTPYSGILFRKQDTKYVTRISQEKEISQKIARRLKEDFRAVNFKFSPGSIDLQPLIWEGFSPSVGYTYIINLDKSLDEIWKSMEDKRRNDIRKAERDGISVVPSDDFEWTLSLVEKTFARQDIRAGYRVSAAFSYNSTLKERNLCKSFLARDKDGDYTAVAYIVWDNKRSYYLLGGYDPKRRHHGASALAIWEAIKFTKEQLGLREFDFEGSMMPKIEQFFRKFGGEQVACYRVSWAKPYLKGALFVKKVAGAVLHPLRLLR